MLSTLSIFTVRSKVTVFSGEINFKLNLFKLAPFSMKIIRLCYPFKIVSRVHREGGS